MADTTTTNYGWTKPEPGASTDTWATKLNANFDDIDTELKAVSDSVGAAVASIVIHSLTASSGTFTPDADHLFAIVEAVGGGGGGSNNTSDGSNGSNTTFSTLTAGGGGGASSGEVEFPGSGGTASGGDLNLPGSPGHITTGEGANGGASFFGGAGKGGGTIVAAATNSGSGGGGKTNGYGGGAGGYVRKVMTIASPTGYVVGAGGNGASGAGDGAAGRIVITEYLK